MRFYRALLRLYPRSFRSEYGDQMLAVIAERRRDDGGAGGRRPRAAAPLPYAEPDRLVRFLQHDRQVGGTNVLSPGNYRDLVAGATAFASVAAHTRPSTRTSSVKAPPSLEAIRE